MSIADDLNTRTEFLGMPSAVVPPADTNRPLHRVANIRRQQGISLRSAARRMGASMDQVRQQEQETCDMTLSELYRWQQTLDVPIVDLLLDVDTPLANPVMTRARLLRVMKTARSIKEMACAAGAESLERLSTMLEQQLIELMPELKDVAAWHSVGQRRTQDELGRAADRILPDTFFSDNLG